MRKRFAQTYVGKTKAVGINFNLALRKNAWITACLIGFILLGIFGITNSSIAQIGISNQGRSGSGVLYGEPRAIRSDEYMRSTPWKIGLLNSGSAEFNSPLAFSQNALLYPDPDNFFDWVSSVDTTWPRYVPFLRLEQEFAFQWWTPTLLALIFIPLFLGLLGTSSGVAILTALIMISSPVNAWWSMWLTPILAFSALAGFAYVRILHRSGSKFLNLAILTFACLKLISCYQPWVIVVTPMFVVAAITMKGPGISVRLLLRETFVSATVAFAFISAFLYFNKSALEVLQATSYPGSRRSSGEAVSNALTWGAPHLEILNRNPRLLASNPSEISSSLSFLLIACLAFVITNRVQLRNKWKQIAALFFIPLLWLAWTSLSWGGIGLHVPLLNLVPPVRAAAVIGLLGTLLVSLLLALHPEKFEAKRSQLSPTIFSILAAITTYEAGQSLKNIMPRLGYIRIALACIAVGLLVYFVSSTMKPHLALVGVLAISVAMTFQTNPLQLGISGIAGSGIKNLQHAAKGKSSIWASDSAAIDAVLMANGIESISGQQLVGPNTHAWEILDQNRLSTNSWNRGASYITFEWTTDLEPQFANPSGDVIRVSISPCELKKRFPNLDVIASTTSLSFSCLTKIGEFEQSGSKRTAYELTAS